jgi:predicted O-methyltransferase YrrM
VTRHEFLAALHELLRPRTYLEVGVQHGWSLRLASPDTKAIGVDPHPQLVVDTGHATVFAETSDVFFARNPADLTRTIGISGIELAFIDGMHLYEYALRDFVGVERWAHPHGLVVFDDVLPRNQREAARTQCPGDWTGDVWRVEPVLQAWRPDLRIALVDTHPTGVMVAYRLDPANTVLVDEYDEIVRHWPLVDALVPPSVIRRDYATDPDSVLAEILEWRSAL